MKFSSPPVIAIDGPAASGKSSVARALAERLGIDYVNTGTMYRAVTWLALERGVAPDDPGAVARCLEAVTLETGVENGETFFRLDGVDPEPHLRGEEINRAVSAVAAAPGVREILVMHQRALAESRPVVMEGRDIGSVVFPQTPFKFYIDASPEVRRRRRADQGHADDPGARDRSDSSRATAPLVVAADAEVIDTSQLSIEGVVEEILVRLERKGFAGLPPAV